MENKVIITGGAGFIGSNLVKKLLENGTEKILIIDDLSTGKLNNLEEFSKNKLIFDDYENYTSWIQDKKELYYDYDMRGKGAEDIHQNEAGHLVQSLIFKRQIT